MGRFCDPYSFFAEDTIEFLRSFSARTILALFPKRLKTYFLSTKKYFSAALNISDFRRFQVIELANAILRILAQNSVSIGSLDDLHALHDSPVNKMYQE